MSGYAYLLIHEQAAETMLFHALGVLFGRDTALAASRIADANLAIQETVWCEDVLPDKETDLRAQLHQWKGLGWLDDDGLLTTILVAFGKDELKGISQSQGR